MKVGRLQKLKTTSNEFLQNCEKNLDISLEENILSKPFQMNSRYFSTHTSTSDMLSLFTFIFSVNNEVKQEGTSLMVPQFLPPADLSARLTMECPCICCLVFKGIETRIGT